jgi:PAS domain S-box-containing protein
MPGSTTVRGLVPHQSVSRSGDLLTTPVVLNVGVDVVTLTALTLIVCGAVVLGYASVWVRRLIAATQQTPTQRRWQVLFGLTLFFLAGYLGTIVLVWTRAVEALITLTGTVFFGGALFVFLVVWTSKSTIDRLVETTVSRDFLDDVLASMGDALLIVSPDGDVDEANPAATDLFECDYETLLGTEVDDLFVGDWSPFGDGAEPSETSGEARIVTTTGEIVPVLFSASSLSTNGTTECVVICTIRDITRRKRREQELQRQNDRLDEFASVISHDLRNPLGIAQGHLDIARETGDPDHFEAVDSALDRIECLVDALLELAQQGRTVDDPAPVQLDEVVEMAWQTVDTATTTLRTEGDLGATHADEVRLRQALENLFRNSVEHGSTGSRPEADDSAEHGGPTVTVGPLPDASGFYVEDDGPGISPDDREDVFENGYSTQESGTGFGLSIVRTIIEAHDWDISLTDGTEGGARFEIRTSRTVTGDPPGEPPTEPVASVQPTGVATDSTESRQE